MKQKGLFLLVIKWILFSSFFLSSEVYAHLISITATTPFPPTIPVSSSATATFTVTNITSRVSITPINESTFPAGSGLSVSSSTCGALLAPAQSCVINVLFNAPSTTQVISTALKVRASPSIDGVQYPIVISVTPVTNRFIAAATGPNEITTLPLIVATTNGGASWSVKSILSQSPGFFSAGAAVSCTGNIGTGRCAVVGQDGTTSAGFIVLSQNGGVDWNGVVLSGLPAISTFSSVASVGEGSSAIIVAVGFDAITPTDPFFYVSTDGGSTWIKKSATGTPPLGNLVFSEVNCTGEGGTALCAAVGSTFPTSHPLIIVSQDGGQNWAYKDIPGVSDGQLFHVSCTGGTFCSAVGADFFGQPLLAVSSDSGNTWVNTPISGIVPNGQSFSSISCTGSGSNVICATVGSQNPGVSLIASSTRGGLNWSAKTLASGVDNTLSSVSCVENNSAAATCVAVGNIFVTSNDGDAVTWDSKNAAFFANSTLQSISCMNNNSGTLCYAAGFRLDGSFNDIPLVAVSNGINTLETVPISGSTDFGILVSISASPVSLALPHKIMSREKIVKNLFKKEVYK